MTYCVGVKLEEGLIFASDSRTHAGVDNYAKFCKMTVFERAGDRVLVLLSSGGLAATQAVISVLRMRAAADPPHLWSVASLFDVANLVADAMRDIERRDGPFLESGGLSFNASFILGGQIAGEEMRLFRIYAEGNFIEAGTDTPALALMLAATWQLLTQRRSFELGSTLANANRSRAEQVRWCAGLLSRAPSPESRNPTDFEC